MLHKRCCFASCQSTKKNNINKFFKVLVSLFMLTEKIVNWHAKKLQVFKKQYPTFTIRSRKSEAKMPNRTG